MCHPHPCPVHDGGGSEIPWPFGPDLWFIDSFGETPQLEYLHCSKPCNRSLTPHPAVGDSTNRYTALQNKRTTLLTLKYSNTHHKTNTTAAQFPGAPPQTQLGSVSVPHGILSPAEGMNCETGRHSSVFVNL